MDQLSGFKGRVSDAASGAKKPKFRKEDALAGLTTGIANVPDGMASAVLAGINPIYGIYTLIIGTPIAALTASTQLMMFNTTSAMTLVAVDGLGSTSGDERVQRMIMVALIAGVFQLALGLLGLGMLTKFVSNSVMVGFLTGIASLIIMAQLWDLTGFTGDSGTKLQNTALLMKNLGDVDLATTFIGVGTFVLMFVLARSPKLGNFNLLLALGVSILVQLVFSFNSVQMVSSIPRSLPSFQIPEFKYLGTMLIAGIATGTVGLLQAAGVAQAFPNPDGSETSDSRDFSGQGVANIATSFFQGMAGGGSLSGTALNVSAGAVSRFANVVQAGVVLVIILVFSGILSRIPSAALAALLIYAALLSIKWGAINAIAKSSWMSVASMLLTFLATLIVPLQQAVMFGVVVAGVLFIYRASIDVTVKQLSVRDGHFVLEDPPEALESNAVTTLDVTGNLFYAGARTMVGQLPDASEADQAVVVMRVRGQTELGTTFFKVVSKYSEQIQENGGKFLLAGVDNDVKKKMQKSGALDTIGASNVFESSSILGDSTLAAMSYGEALREGFPHAKIDALLNLAATPVGKSDEAVTTAPSQSPAEALSEDIDSEASMLSRLPQLFDRYIPWRSTAAWKAVAILGGFLTVIGLAQILAPDLLKSIIRSLTGATMLVVAVFWIYQTLSRDRLRPGHVPELRMLSAGFAFMGGTALVMSDVTDLVSVDSARMTLGLSFIFIGIVGVASVYYRNLKSRERTFELSINGVVIGIGVIELIQLQRNSSWLNDLRWLTFSLGVAVLIYAYFLARETNPVRQAEDVNPSEQENADPAEDTIDL